jgi:hypothetical protein
MNLDPLAFDVPIFSQRQALDVTEADSIWLDSMIRQGAIEPSREGRSRLFSMLLLVTVDVTHMLVEKFKMRPSSAGEVAAHAADGYRQWFDFDRREIAAGKSWSALTVDRGDHQAEQFIRDEDGRLRPCEDGDDPAESIGIIVPVRLIARRILSRIARLDDAAAEASA